MFKKTIFTLMLMAMMGFVSAQTLQLEWDGTVYNDGETIICNTEEYGEFTQKFHVRNLASVDQNVVLEKEVIEPLEGVMEYFCWGNCYLPETMVTPPVTVPADSLSFDEMSMHAMFEDNVFGYVLVKYSIYDARTPEERISIVIKFHKSGVGIADNARPMVMSKAYPNPASSFVNFNYSFDGNLTAVVYNLLGQEVIREDLNANDGQMSLSVADLNDGIYFCTMMVNGRAWTTQKFIVKK